MSRPWQNALLLLAATLLVVWPLLTVPVRQVGPAGGEVAIFTGADGQAVGIISQLAPDYQPWAKPLLVPPSGEIESLLFALQAAVGAGILGYCFGVKRERARWEADSGASRVA
jgi:cobalt/nickel transport protein